MSIVVLARKTRATVQAGSSHNRSYAKFVTGERNKMGGCCRSSNLPGPGLRRGRARNNMQRKCCPPAQQLAPSFPVGVVRPKVPIKQMGYGVYLKSRQGRATNAAGPGLLAGRIISKERGNMNYAPPSKPQSCYIEDKKVDRLRLPECCPAGNRHVTFNNDGNITSGQTEFTRGCSYVFTWPTIGLIISIAGQSVVSNTSFNWTACGCNDLVIDINNVEKKYKIVTPPSITTCPRNSSRWGACSRRKCVCTKLYNYRHLGGVAVANCTEYVKTMSLQKQRPAYVRGKPMCCVTTKDLKCKTSGDYITRVKGRETIKEAARRV